MVRGVLMIAEIISATKRTRQGPPGRDPSRARPIVTLFGRRFGRASWRSPANAVLQTAPDLRPPCRAGRRPPDREIFFAMPRRRADVENSCFA